MPDLFRPADTDVSYCGCPLAMGVYGAHGWHWTRATVTYMIDQEKRRFASERKGMSKEMLRKEWDSWMDRERFAGRVDKGGTHERWAPYLGVPIQVEPCPAYRAVYRESLETEKRRIATSTKKRKVYGEEET